MRWRYDSIERLSVCILFNFSLTARSATWNTTTRGMRRFPVPPDYKDVVMPPEGNRLLPPLDPIPTVPFNMKPHKYQMRKFDMRGPELVHNQLMYNQYGIIALTGGSLNGNHTHYIRAVINRYLNTKKSFAIWRIDPPWKSVTKRGIGKRMGGGRPSIHHYETPVKAGRVIVEVGGKIEFEEIYYFLNSVTARLPFPAMTVSADILAELKKEQEDVNRRNVNPINYRRCIEKNLLNCKVDNAWSYDDIWHGRYI